MKRFLLSLHRWCGLSTGIILLVIGVSGSILVYRHPVDRLLNPALYRIDASAARCSIDSLFAIVYARHGAEFTSVSFDIPSPANEPVEFTFSSRGESFFGMKHYIVDVHPFTGAVLREGDCNSASTSLVHWIMYIHDGARFGNIGMLVAALCGVTMFASILTGLLFYGGKVLPILTCSVTLRGLTFARFLRSLHVYVAVWSLLLTLIVFFTGFWMVREVFSGERWRSAEKVRSGRIAVSIDSCIAKSRVALQGFSPDFADIDFSDGGAIEIDGEMNTSAIFRGGDASSVTFDPRNGKLLGVVDERSALFPGNITPAFWALHAGKYGGEIIRMMYAIFGLVPGVLSISGFIMWRTRGTDR